MHLILFNVSTKEIGLQHTQKPESKSTHYAELQDYNFWCIDVAADKHGAQFNDFIYCWLVMNLFMGIN